MRPSGKEILARAYALKATVVLGTASVPRATLDQLRASWSSTEYDLLVADLERWHRGFLDATAYLECDLSPWERDLRQTPVAVLSQQQQIDASWRIEALQALMWELGLVLDLPPNGVRAPEALIQGELLGADAAQGPFRTPSEVDRARDIAELWHWRCRTRQLTESPWLLPKGVDGNALDRIVKRAARRAFDDGAIPRPIEKDFPVSGKAFRNLTDEEYQTVRSIAHERHFALNWVCGFAPNNAWDDTPTST